MSELEDAIMERDGFEQELDKANDVIDDLKEKLQLADNKIEGMENSLNEIYDETRKWV